MNDDDVKPRSPKFRYTREIVRIALADGMTQEEIARLCRTHQSAVSAWASGKGRAAEISIKPLVNRYGHRLNRATSRLYLVQGEAMPPWSETPTGKLVHRLLNDAKAYTREQLTDDEWQAMIRGGVERRVRPAFLTTVDGRHVLSDSAPCDEDGNLLEQAYVRISKADLAAAEGSFDFSTSAPVNRAWTRIAIGARLTTQCRTVDIVKLLEGAHEEAFLRLVRIEGAPIWRHVLGRPKVVSRREGRHGERREAVIEPVGRWIVHPVGAAKFRLVVQKIRRLVGVDAAAWGRATNGHDPDIESILRGEAHVDDGRVRSDDDVARWVGTVLGPFDLPELLAEIERRLPAAGPHDRAVVPFTLRKALVERGYDVPGIEFLSL